MFGGLQGRAASAEGIENHITFITAGFDDSLQQCLGLLCGITQLLVRTIVDDRYVCPYILDGHAGHFIEVTLVLRDSAGASLNDSSLAVQVRHFFLCCIASTE